jgi:hypothetical protein
MLAALASPCRIKRNHRRRRRIASGRAVYAYVGGNPISLVDPMGLEGHGPWNDPGWFPQTPSDPCDDYWPRYWNNYRDFVSQYAIDVGPYAAAMAGGLWPKSLAPAGGFRGPLLGSNNPLTSVPRGFGMPGGGSPYVRAGAGAIGVATVGIGMYDATIETEGLAYAYRDTPASSPSSGGSSSSSSACGCHKK